MNISIKPELATLVDKPPEGENWLHEIKFDGYRILSLITKDSVVLLTRNEKDWANKFPMIVKSLDTCPQPDTMLDGELVVLDNQGRSRFQLLQNALSKNDVKNLKYYVFDIPYYRGKNLKGLPLIKRKKILANLFKQWDPNNVILTEYIQGNGQKIFKDACEHFFEGIVSKEIQSKYEGTRKWLKIKCGNRQEFIILGFTEPKGSRKYFGALLLGFYQDGQLTYCGKVGTGFDSQLLASLYQQFLKLKLNDIPNIKNLQLKTVTGLHWIKPKLVAEIAFSEWTREGFLRQASFVGLRLDKKPEEIKREG